MNYVIHDATISIIHCEYPTTDALFAFFHISKKTKYAYYQKGHIRVNQCVTKTNTHIQKQDKIEITCILEEDELTPWFHDLSICYEDELFLIVNKPSGLLIHSDGIEKNYTLCNFVKGYYIQQQIQSPVRPIHRLDKDTSGLVIFSKLPFFQPLLDAMLSQKQIQRDYYAIVKGNIQAPYQCITQAIGKNRHHSQKMRVSVNGKYAKTEIYRKQEFRDYTLIQCRLHTGRTHQIRVHLAHLHHPLLSDALYGTMDRRIARLALHAFCVRFYHPILQKNICVQCSLPNDMSQLLQK